MPVTADALPTPTIVEIDGAAIATYVLEPPRSRREGPDVVCMHGTPWSAEVWWPVARRLADRHRVFLWDMPGYGRSTKSPEVPVDLIAQRQRFAELVRIWNPVRPHVLAHDIGGAVALGAHLFNEVAMSSLYLLDAVTLRPWGSAFFALVGKHAEVFQQLPADLHEALVHRYIAGAAVVDLSHDTVRGLVEPWLGEVGQAAFYRQVAQLSEDHTEPICARLADVTCRVEIGWGVNDPWLPVEQAGRLRDALPGDVVVTLLDGVGHLAPLERTEELIGHIRRWLVR